MAVRLWNSAYRSPRRAPNTAPPHLEYALAPPRVKPDERSAAAGFLNSRGARAEDPAVGRVRAQRRKGRPAHRVAILAGLLALGCAVPRGEGAGFSYFERPRGDDPWSLPIARWQARVHDGDAAALPDALASAGVAARQESPPDRLGPRYAAFLSEHRRRFAREVASWVQTESRDRYREDGALDVWPTLEEALAAGGDDCDGLELLAFRALSQFGFPEGRVFRAILRHRRFERHHMVTLWFEAPDDPWVIDPTGAVTTRMRRMSEVSEWVPIKVFSDEVEYTVRRVPAR